MMQPITITADLAYAIWNYIASKPFAEVGNLATAYQAMVGSQIAAIEAEAQAAAESDATAEVVAEAESA
jgi:hypothetical protein